jgi:D-alanine-D-alanine ligase
MISANGRFPFSHIVLIADLALEEPEVPLYLRRNLEQSSQEGINRLCATITNLGLEVTHYTHPRLLAENASAHRDHVVLSIFGGEVSRNRMALVPAICETMGISYIGPDTYGRIVCQDKEISKSLAAEAGLTVAPHRIIRAHHDLRKLSDFPTPFVAKPLWEGSSIGIGPDNLVRDPRVGVQLVSRILEEFQQPILVESFIPGREVSYCFIDAPGELAVRSLAESVWEDDSEHYDSNLFDSLHKQVAREKQVIRAINSELDNTTAASLETLVTFIRPVGYGRIDGKLKNGIFTFIEATPDAWLGYTGSFINSFRDMGIPYEEVIARVLLSGRPTHQDQ